MLHAKLIAVGFSDGSVRVCPLIPDGAVQIVDVVGFSLPDPEHLLCTGLDGGLS